MKGTANLVSTGIALLFVIEVFIEVFATTDNQAKGSMAQDLCYDKRGITTQFILSIPNFIFKGDFINILDIT